MFKSPILIFEMGIELLSQKLDQRIQIVKSLLTSLV